MVNKMNKLSIGQDRKSFRSLITAGLFAVTLAGCQLPQVVQDVCEAPINAAENTLEFFNGGPVNYAVCSQLFNEITALIACAESACASGGDVAVAALSDVIALDGEEAGATLLMDAAAEGLIVNQEVIAAAYGGAVAGGPVAGGAQSEGGNPPACTIDWKIVCEETWKKHKSKYYKCKNAGFTPAIPAQCQPYINPEGEAGISSARSSAVLALD